MIFKPNMDFIAEEADRIVKEQLNKKNRPDIKRYQWKLGENILRLLPSWGVHGKLFHEDAKHFNMPPNSEWGSCLTKTWPKLFSQCPVCEDLEELKELFPAASFYLQESSLKWCANVIDRDDESAGPQIVSMTNTVYSWIVLKMKSKNVGDITDVTSGIDLCVDKKIGKRRDGKDMVEYDPGFVPRATPLAETNELIESWCSNLYNLDEIMKPLSDDKIAALSVSSSSMVTYFKKKFEDKAERLPAFSINTQEANKVPTKTYNAKSNMPACFAGNNNPELHSGPGLPEGIEGTFGFDPRLEKCQMCGFEIRCSDFKAAKEKENDEIPF